MNLLPNQVYLVDTHYNLKWIYDVDPDDWEFVSKDATKDEHGNIILEMPMLSKLSRWSPNIALKAIDAEIQELGIPTIDIDVKKDQTINLSELNNATNDGLEEMLSLFGGWRSYLEAQVADAEARKSVLESGVEEGLARQIAMLARGYREREERVPNQQALRGEAFAVHPQLKKAREELIEAEALYIKLLGLKNQYKSYYETISRVIALRTSTTNV